MILVRAPFRISFVGGGSDLRAFYRRSAGGVVSTTIDKYMYIALHPYFHSKIRVKYSRLEDVDRVQDIQHPIVRECLLRHQIPKGMEIASFADVPAGTGLGSSSAFTVALLHALNAHCGQPSSPEALAAAACEVEIERLGEPIGKQDQYASAYGGLNFLRFHPDESVDVEPIAIEPCIRREFERHLLLFYVGQERSAGSILAEQSENMSNSTMLSRVNAMVTLAAHFRCALEAGKLDDCGALLHENWQLKRALAEGVSSADVDDVYERALAAGASGGKLLGAGTGGFLLLYCKPELQSCVREALSELREMPVALSSGGSQVIYSDEAMRQ